MHSSKCLKALGVNLEFSQRYAIYCCRRHRWCGLGVFSTLARRLGEISDVMLVFIVNNHQFQTKCHSFNLAYVGQSYFPNEIMVFRIISRFSFNEINIRKTMIAWVNSILRKRITNMEYWSEYLFSKCL